MSGAWIQRFASRTEATARMFCFPYAGGSAAAYRLWPGGLPEQVDLCAVQLPGRASRLREPPIASIPGLVDAILPAIVPLMDLPFVLFGHSMGAVIAYEVARALSANNGPLPAHLVVSARRPPHMPGDEAPLRDLPDGEFIDEVNRRYGGIPPEVLECADLMELLLPGLRADILALETHQPDRRSPIECPISVYGGSNDGLAPRHHLDAWRDETASAFRLRTFCGDHFYLVPRRDELLADLALMLAPLLPASRVSMART